MIRVLFLISILMCPMVAAYAERILPVPAPTTPRTVAVIGKSSDKDFTARFAVLKDELAANPNAQAYIINYGTKSQIQKRVRQIRNALTFHKIDAKRVTIVFGGDRKSVETKIYLVPNGAESSKPVPTARIFATVLRTRKRELAKQIKNFQDELYKDPTSSGYIINYGTDEEITRREKIFRDNISPRYDPVRITFVRGGNPGKLRTVFWIVPPGAQNPTP